MSFTSVDDSCAEIVWACDVTTDDPYSTEQLASAEQSARLLLWSLTGRRVGCFTTTGEAFVAQPVAACSVECCRLMLRNGPVRSIVEVRVGDVVLDASSYSLQNGMLVLGACPLCGGCEPSIEVDYDWGVVPPVGYETAIGQLACEFLADLVGSPCKLPARALSVSRQGVSVELLDPTTTVESGLTGLPGVDSFIRALNPNNLQQRSRVVSPDLPGSV